MSVTSWFDISTMASSAGAKYPELVAAQWALESGWGSSISGKNNYFGIKGAGTKHQTKEFINCKEITIVDEFKDFISADECVEYLVDRWYKNWKDYKGVNNASSRENAARMLVTQGYATDPRYAEKLIDIMSKNSAPREVKAPAEAPVALKEAAKWYNALPHQILAWDALQATLTADQRSAFSKAYRSTIPKPVVPKPVLPAFPLGVPYCYQRDSKTGHGERSCQA